MDLSMSMFATQTDYWKARAGIAEMTAQETAKELGCHPDSEAMLERVHGFRTLAIAIEGDLTEPEHRREYAKKLLTPNV